MKVVIAGGGVGALEATLALQALAAGRVAVEVIAPEHDFVYRPLSVTEPFHAGETKRFPLERLVSLAGGTLKHGRVARVDPGTRTVFTEDGSELGYDALLVALGARSCEAIEGALTFAGPESAGEFEALLDEALAGGIRKIVFALPGGVAWPLPLYELALQTGEFLADRGASGIELTLVTPEQRPLGVFGRKASDAVAELLDARGIPCRLDTTPVRFDGSTLQVLPAERIGADRVVALPRLEGPGLEGLACDSDGFIPIDEYCHIESEPDVWAVGDATRFPLKQGGIATEQADVAAAGIAAAAGAAVEPESFKPVLRGILLTGMVARYLRAEPGTTQSAVDTEPLWWPPAKIVGHYLAPFLASELGLVPN